ncbi:MAG: ROK family protein [Anaerolineaceae bacterium]
MIRSEKPVQGQSTNNILGMNLDGERILLVYGSMAGMVYERLSVPTPNQESFAAILELIMLQADRLLTLTQAQHLPVPDRVSVAISGNLDSETGIVGSAPDFPQWKLEPVRSQLSLRFNLPVYIEQKANAGALAEYYLGAAQKLRNLVFISMAPTVRVGVLTEGKLYRNSGGSAGQIGNIMLTPDGPAGFGRPGSLTGYASARGLLELARLRHPNHWEADTDLFQLIEAAQAGDPYAQEVFEEAGRQLGKGLSSLTLLLRPEMIIIGYPGCLADEYLLAPARAALAQTTSLDEAQLPKLMPSQLCIRLPELEALAPAIHHARTRP